MFYHFEEGDLKILLSADHEILHPSRKANFREWKFRPGTGVALRKMGIDIKDEDYLDFISVCVDEELSVEKKL